MNTRTSSHFRLKGLLCISLILSPALAAQVTLTDLGNTPPSTYNVGHLGTLDDRVSFDAGDSLGQSFTPSASGTLEFLHIAYNAGGSGTFTLYVDTDYNGGGGAEIMSDGTAHPIDIASFIADPNGLSGASATDTNSGPGYWIRLDFLAADIQLVAGQQAAYFMVGNSESDSDDSSYIYAPRWNASGTDEYAGGGVITGTGYNPGGSGVADFGFAVSVAGSPPAAIKDDFDSGNLAGGSGWLGPWSYGTVTNISPLDDGGNHLSLTGLSGSSGGGRQWDSAVVSSTAATYTTRFDLRVDALPDFGTTNGRLGITESSTNATNTSNLMSWIIFASTNFGLGDGNNPTWGFHDGNGSGNFVSALVNSGMAVTPGHTYRFEVIVSPADLAYAVVIDNLDDGNPAYESPRLGFRRGTTISNPYLTFSTQSVTGSGDMTIDTVSISAGGELPPVVLPPAAVADRVAGNLILLNDNGGWSWYQDERSLYDADAGKILFTSTANYLGYGGEPRDGDIDTVSFDPATGARKRFVHAKIPFRGTTADDHNIGAVWKRTDGRYLVTYCDHLDASRNTRMRISTNPGDNSAWNPEFTFNWGPSGDITYSNLLFLSAEGTGQGRLYNFTRGSGRDPHLSYSDDQGDTWTYGGRLSSQPSSLGYSNGYYKFKSNGANRIDFICTEAHPRDFDNSIYHGYIQGGKSYNSQGVEIDANIFDDTAPAPQAFTQVWQTEGVSANTLHHGWTSEIEFDAAGRPVVLFTTRYGNAVVNGHAGAGDHRIFHGRFDGANWHTTELGRMGELFHAGEQDYTGIGCIHPNDPGTIYIASYIHPGTDELFTSKKREIFQGKTADQGATWTWTQLTFDSTVDNARPIIPSWDADHTALLWWRGGYPWQRDYDLSVVGMILDSDKKTGNITYHDATTANTSLVDGSPLVPTGPAVGTGVVSDGEWHLSTNQGGNEGGAFCSNFGGSELSPVEDAPALKTTITGLAAGSYDVFVYFLSPPVVADWRIAAGFAADDLLNCRRASSQQAEVSQFEGAVEVLWTENGTALYRGYVGRKTITAGDDLVVFIDDAPSSVAYDGIGVAPVLPNLRIAPGATSMIEDEQTLFGDVINEGTLILKGNTPLSYHGTFTNNGFLDLLTYSGEVPPEWLNQGNVLKPREGLAIREIELGDDTVTISIDSHAGHFYQLQTNADLDPQNWQSTGTPMEGLGTQGVPTTLQLSGPKPELPHRFYRVAVD